MASWSDRLGRVGTPEVGKKLPGAFALLFWEGELAVQEAGVLPLHDVPPQCDCRGGVGKPVKQPFGLQLGEHAGFL